MSGLKRGDIVVYQHTRGGDESRNGSCGIVEAVHTDDRNVTVKWLLPAVAKGNYNRPHPWNLQKIGEVEHAS